MIPGKLWSSWNLRLVVLVGSVLLPSLLPAIAQLSRLNYADVGAFFDAIAMRDTNAMAMLEANTNLAFARDNGSKLPLLQAAEVGNVPLVKRLIELGADINAAGDTYSSGGSQNTALHWAISRNHPEVCKFLLEAGANPNIMAFGSTAPLHLAFKEHHEEVAGWLLDYGAEPFLVQPNAIGYPTAFELDITSGSGELVPRMLGQDSEHPLGTKSLQKPRRSKQPRRDLTTAAEVLAGHGQELLVTAASRGELEAVQALLMARVSVTNAPGANSAPILQTFSLAAYNAAISRPSAMAQLDQTRARLKEPYIPKADPRFVAQLHQQEADQAARVKATDPDRWQKILEILIAHGANYDAFAATALNDTNRLTQLITADKNVAQSRDRDGQTPLHWAVRTDRLPLASFWIQSGTPLDATNSAGQTALHLAATTGKAEFVKVLLAAQSPTTIRDTNGWMPLDAAIHAKQSDSIHLLMTDKSAPPHPERGLTMTLHEAAAAGNIAALAALLETETNLDARNELGLTPLQLAVTKGHLAAAALLADKGANVNGRDPDGNTLLHQIFLQDRFTAYDRPPTNWLTGKGKNPQTETYVKYLTVPRNEQGPNDILQGTSFLLACGVDAQATNNAGLTVMQLVTEEKTGRGVFFFNDDREQLFKLLSSAGAKIDQRDTEGNTALHLCGQDTLVDRTAGLIAGGADINATNYAGQTPLHKFAEKIGGWDMNESGTNEPFQLLVRSKANVNAQDNEGRTPLHVLATADHTFKTEAVGLLLEYGANPNLRDKHGRTPVHLFLTGKWPWSDASECIGMLAGAGADLSAKDDQGKTPLHYLAGIGGPSQSSLFFFHSVGDTFTSAKADLDVRDNDGDTPLMIAGKTETTDVYAWLLKAGANQDATNKLGQTPRQLYTSSPTVQSKIRLLEMQEKMKAHQKPPGQH